MSIKRILPGVFLAVCLAATPFAGAAHHEEPLSDHGERAMGIEKAEAM